MPARFGSLIARLALVACAVAAQPATAQTTLEIARSNSVFNNLVDLQAEAQREVQNDTLNASLYVESNDSDAARLANTLNRTANDALGTAKDFRSVRARSGANQTWPVYDRAQKLTGWRGRAEIRIDSKDFPAASALIAKLQSSMQLGQLTFSVSPDLRRQTENDLIAEAVGAFRGRADVLRQALGAKNYRIRRMALNTGGGMVPRMFSAQRGVAAEATVTPPQFEGGVSQITVNLSGTVEIE